MMRGFFIGNFFLEDLRGFKNYSSTTFFSNIF